VIVRDDATAEPPRARGRPRRAETRAEIVHATIALLAERGFRATTMDAIADRAGVGKNTIYRRWCSKEELIADAVDELTAIPLQPSEADTYAALLDRVRDVVGVFADPVVGRILPDLLGELQRNRTFAVAFSDRIVRPRRAAVNALIQRARAEGALRDTADADVVADLLVGPALVRLLFPLGLPEIDERYADAVFEALWRGIAA
jgi:AcrR family transcriptional regulator